MTVSGKPGAVAAQAAVLYSQLLQPYLHAVVGSAVDVSCTVVCAHSAVAFTTTALFCDGNIALDNVKLSVPTLPLTQTEKV